MLLNDSRIIQSDIRFPPINKYSIRVSCRSAGSMIDVHSLVGMDRGVLPLLATLCKEDLDLRDTPSKHSCKETNGKCMQSI